MSSSTSPPSGKPAAGLSPAMNSGDVPCASTGSHADSTSGADTANTAAAATGTLGNKVVRPHEQHPRHAPASVDAGGPLSSLAAAAVRQEIPPNVDGGGSGRSRRGALVSCLCSLKDPSERSAAVAAADTVDMVAVVGQCSGACALCHEGAPRALAAAERWRGQQYLPSSDLSYNTSSTILLTPYSPRRLAQRLPSARACAAAAAGPSHLAGGPVQLFGRPLPAAAAVPSLTAPGATTAAAATAVFDPPRTAWSEPRRAAPAATAAAARRHCGHRVRQWLAGVVRC